MDSNDPKFFNLQKSMPYARNDTKGEDACTRERYRKEEFSARKKRDPRANRSDLGWA